jgi:hypothetical protein
MRGDKSIEDIETKAMSVRLNFYRKRVQDIESRLR